MPASSGGATSRSSTSHGRIGPSPTRSGKLAEQQPYGDARDQGQQREAGRQPDLAGPGAADRSGPATAAASGTATTSDGAAIDSRAWVCAGPASVRGQGRRRPRRRTRRTARGSPRAPPRAARAASREERAGCTAASSASPTPRAHAISPTTCGQNPRAPARSTAPSPQGADVSAVGSSDEAPRNARVAIARGRSQNATLPASTSQQRDDHDRDVLAQRLPGPRSAPASP